MKPKISVCIPTYNGASFLNKCLDSVLAQTNSNFEVIISDDCSTDNSFEIAQRFQKSDQRFKIFQNKENIGLVRNWNKCLELAEGEWIKFLFQDDLMVENCLEKMLNGAKFGKSLVCCKRKYIFDNETDSTTKNYFTVILKQLDELFIDQEEISASKISRAAMDNFPMNLLGEPIAALFKKELIYQYGFFNTSLKQLCDYEYLLRISSNQGLSFVPEPLVTFMVHTKSTTSKNKSLNRFSSSVLDGLIFFHELNFNPHFANFRATIRKERPKVSLVDLFAYEARKAKSLAKQNTSNLEELKCLIEKYPAINLCSSRVKIYSTVINKLLNFYA